MSKFIHLPTDILLYLFATNFTLQELFHLRGLSVRMQCLIESRIGTRKSLKLFWCFEDVQLYTNYLYNWKLEGETALALKNGQFDDDLILCGIKFRESTSDWLLQMFPALNHLLIFFSIEHAQQQQNYLSHLPHLVSRWSNTLVRLSLCGKLAPTAPENKQQIVRELCGVMNTKLPHLRHLDLGTELLFAHADEAMRQTGYANSFIGLNIVMAQLERIYLLFTDESNNVPEQVLHMLAHAQQKKDPNTQTKLYIFIHQYRRSLFDKLCQLQAPPLATIEHLTIASRIGEWPDHATVLDRIGSSLAGSLSSLCLEQLPLRYNWEALPLLDDALPVISIVAILTNLRKLPQLKELKLQGFSLCPLSDIHCQMEQPQLATVNHLTIQDNRNFEQTSQLESLSCAVFFAAIRHIFPSIRSLYLKLDYPLTEEIDPPVHLNQFVHLTRFELSVYPKKFDWPIEIGHLLSEKYRKRIETYSNSNSDDSKIVRDWRKSWPGGRQIWKLKTIDVLGQDSTDEEKKKNKSNRMWTTVGAIVCDPYPTL